MVTTIIGMQHSGTTCLAEALIRAGLRFGPKLRKGTLEDNSIVVLNATLVYWANPHVHRHTDADRRMRNEIVAGYGEGDWGFKDPMTMWTLDLWQEALPLKLLGTYTHPKYAVEYFKHWFKLDHSHAESLWCRYNQRLLDIHSRSPFAVVSFDAEDDAYSAQLSVAVESVGLPTNVQLWDPAKRKRLHECVGYVMSEEAREIYSRLEAITVRA